MLIATAMGLTTLALTRRPAAGAARATPERRVALPVVVAHGAAALITIGMLLAAAAGNGWHR